MSPSVQYRPALPEQNDNVSHNHPLKEFFILLSGLIGLFLLAVWSVGLLVDWAAGYISPEMEAVVFSSIRASGAAVSDRKKEDLRQMELQHLADELGACTEVGYPLRVDMIKSEAANAFAFPGGRIIVSDGLLDKVRSENGLVFVLAHEMAHFKHRDHLRTMGRGLVLTAVSALLTGAGSDLTQLLAPTSGLGQVRYSQERESMADQSALRTLHCFYGHVGGATEFFEAMQADSGEQGDGIGKYFSSHPEAVQRISDLHRSASASNFAVRETEPLPKIFSPTVLQ